jgi:hypothetical protein
MNQPHKKNLPIPAPCSAGAALKDALTGIGEQTKILIAEHQTAPRARITALLLLGGRAQPMTFKTSKSALAWCEAHATTFYYLPPAITSAN